MLPEVEKIFMLIVLLAVFLLYAYWAGTQRRKLRKVILQGRQLLALDRNYKSGNSVVDLIKSEHAEAVIKTLSEEYGVPAPGLRRLGRGTWGQYDHSKQVITVGDATNAALVLHEFAHHLQNLGKLSDTELAASDFALRYLASPSTTKRLSGTPTCS